ncbi:MAG: hypothetical protein BMS9Abin36_1696 [Gammaproteobacteria bacterium]|nr:MAG: hypothetical protein BMS9Abin36_1696 [Gammaproteobacteria bacterium]
MSTESTEAVATIDNSGRTMGMLAMATAPLALLISPVLFTLLGFFLVLMGLTVSTPEQRHFSFIGLAVAVTAGVIGYVFHTPIV